MNLRSCSTFYLLKNFNKADVMYRSCVKETNRSFFGERESEM